MTTEVGRPGLDRCGDSAEWLLLCRPDRAPAGLALLAVADFHCVYATAAYRRLADAASPFARDVRMAALEHCVRTGRTERLRAPGATGKQRTGRRLYTLEHTPLSCVNGVPAVLELIVDDAGAATECPSAVAAVYRPDGACQYRGAHIGDPSDPETAGVAERPASRAVHPEDRLHVTARWRESLLLNTPLIARYRLILADGGIRWFVERAEPVYDTATQAIHWYGMVMQADLLRGGMPGDDSPSPAHRRPRG